MTGKVRPELTVPGWPERVLDARPHHSSEERSSGTSKWRRGKGGRAGGSRESRGGVGVGDEGEEDEDGSGEGAVEAERVMREGGRTERRAAQDMARKSDISRGGEVYGIEFQRKAKSFRKTGDDSGKMLPR